MIETEAYSNSTTGTNNGVSYCVWGVVALIVGFLSSAFPAVFWLLIGAAKASNMGRPPSAQW